MNSRILAAGLDHGIEKRFSMWAWTWEPRPRTKRPDENRCRSLATVATTSGLRAKATAMLLPSVTFDVCSAAMANGRKGSVATCATHTPS